jgi:hypothetical protein
MAFPKQLELKSLPQLEKILWEHCRRITKKKYKDCYTCPQVNLIGMNAQCGHMHPKGACGATMKYDLRILRLQCFQCNINYGGMGALFKENMDYEIGKEASDKLLAEAKSSKGKAIKARDHYIPLIRKYEKL